MGVEISCLRLKDSENYLEVTQIQILNNCIILAHLSPYEVQINRLLYTGI